MKKLFTTLTLCITVLTTSMASFADPPFDRGHGQKGPKGGPRGEWNDRGTNMTVTMMKIVFAMSAVCVKNVVLSV